ncbi:MAG: TonB-dependent receptor, partial [Rikenellaceae bacterium]|nr:TonB-dependent receptor [Rikenellaceae bacterium]
QTRIDIVLAEDALQLEDVVVIGYGTVKRRDLTGSVASVTGRDMQAVPVTNVTQAMQGRMAGVNITTSDGSPGASVKVRIRGGGSITQSNDPLFVVDGVPTTDISDIPANMIESIDVLKDASATAIYGARGANGVVILTTKAPQAGKIKITYDGYVQFKQISRYLDVMSAKEFVRMNYEIFDVNPLHQLDGFMKAYALQESTAANPNAFKTSLDAYDNVPFLDWQREFYGQNNTSWSHNINMSGGNERTRYSVNYNNFKNDALRIQDWRKRNTVIARLNQVITPKLNADINFQYVNNRTNNPDGTSLSGLMTRPPVDPLGDISPTTNPNFNMHTESVDPIYNPIALMNNRFNQRKSSAFTGRVGLNYEPIEGLVLRAEGQMAGRWEKVYAWSGLLINRTDKGPSASVEQNNTNSYRYVGTATYEVQGLGRDHRLNLMGGYEFSSSRGEKSKMSAKNFPAYWNAAQTFAMFSQYSKDQPISDIGMSHGQDAPSKRESYFGRVNYTLKDRYLFTATVRADGSDVFKKGNQWGVFPAGAIAWRLSEEPFMKGARLWLDNLKVRVSYGQAGNDRIGDDRWRQMWNTGTNGYPFNNVRQDYLKISSGELANPDIKWETTITRNLGVDFGLWKNRFYGTVEYYWNTTKDLLINSAVPTYLGYSSQWTNIGQTRNRGIELTLGGDIIRTKDFLLSANFNIAHNKNKIEKLADNMNVMSVQSGLNSLMLPKVDYLFELGKSIGLIRGYTTEGFYTTADFNYDAANNVYTLKPGVYNSTMLYQLPSGVSGDTNRPFPGALKFKAMKTEGRSDPDNINETDDVTVIGNTIPDFTGGFGLSAAWKGLDLSANFNYSYGNDIFNYQKLFSVTMSQNRTHVNVPKYMENRYRIYDDQGKRVSDPALLDAMNRDARYWYPYQNVPILHSWCIEDGSFLRLNTLTIGYTLPEKIVRKASLQNLRFYATVYNVHTWTGYSGLDPEVDSRATTDHANRNLTPGVDSDAYPRARTFTFGLNLTF